MKLLVCLLSAQTGCHLFGWIYRDGELQSCQCVLVLQSSLCVEVPQSQREWDGDPTFKWSSVVNEMFIVLPLVLPALLYLHQLPPALCMSSSPLRHSNRTSDAVSWFSWVAEFIPFKSNPRKHQQGCNIKSFYLCLVISRVFWEPYFCSNNPVECLPG